MTMCILGLHLQTHPKWWPRCQLSYSIQAMALQWLMGELHLVAPSKQHKLASTLRAGNHKAESQCLCFLFACLALTGNMWLETKSDGSSGTLLPRDSWWGISTKVTLQPLQFFTSSIILSGWSLDALVTGQIFWIPHVFGPQDSSRTSAQ